MRSQRLLSVVTGAFLAGCPLVLAESSIHGHIGNETSIWFNAVGDDQGNASTRTLYGGAYALTGLPGDRWYILSQGHYKFWLPDGTDLEVNDPPLGEGPAYQNAYGPYTQRAYRMGQTFVANGRFFKAAAMTQLEEQRLPDGDGTPINIHFRLLEYGPEGALVWDGGVRGSWFMNAWVWWIVPSPRSVPLVPGKKYFMEFSSDEYWITQYHNDNYLDGEAWIYVQDQQEWRDFPTRDLFGEAHCYTGNTSTDYQEPSYKDVHYGNEVWQVFTANGSGVRRCHMLLPAGGDMEPPHDMYFSIHAYGGLLDPLGPQIGPKKRSVPSPEWGDGNAAVWDSDEVPLVPGNKYLLRVRKAFPPSDPHIDFGRNYGEGMVPQGELFVDGVYQPGCQMQGTIACDEQMFLPLVIANRQVSGLAATQATVSWDTSDDAMSQVEYWTDSNDHQHTTLDETLVTSHVVQLTGLHGSTTYSYEVKSYRDGYEYAREEGQFTTLPDATLVGVVRDGYGAGVKDATVSLTPGGYSGPSAADGSYVVPYIEPGTYAVQCSRVGYQPATLLDQILPAGQTVLDFTILSLAEFVANGGFEEAQQIGDPPAGWERTTGTAAACHSGQLFGTGIQQRNGDWFLTKASNWSVQNGAVYQILDVTPGRSYRLTGYNAVYWAGGSPNDCRQRIAIDRSGGGDPNAPTVVRSDMLSWATEAVGSPWMPLHVTARAMGPKLTVWLVYYQASGNWRVNCFDDISIQAVQTCDHDLDTDVDQEDYGVFQRCLTGEGNPQTDPSCAGFLLDGDDDVDQSDFDLFLACMSGANVPANPACAE